MLLFSEISLDFIFRQEYAFLIEDTGAARHLLADGSAALDR